MWINPVFAETDREALAQLVHAHSLATLVVEEPVRVSHMPLLLERTPWAGSEDGDRIELVGHIPRVDPVADAILDGARLLSIFQGDISYVSPAWYSKPGLPTYNFTMAHLTGPVVVMQDDELREHLVDLIAHHEQAKTAPGPIWTMDDTARRRMEELLPQIIGFRVQVEHIEVKAKLGQNRSVEDQRSVSSCLRASLETSDRRVADQMDASAEIREAPSAP